MRAFAYLAVFSFVAGLALLAAGLLSREEAADAPVQSEPFDARPTLSAATATPSPIGAAASTPTPLPFDGRIARMIAPGVGIDHAVEEIGVTDGQLDVPVDGVNNIGWYGVYPKPGHGKNSVYAAHVNFDRKEGPFARLKSIGKEDRISIVMEGGPTYVYEVVAYQQYSVDTIPTGELIDAPGRPPREEWITLITCGGEFVADPGSDFGRYLHRDVVVARRVE